MKKNQILRIYGTSYKEMTKFLLEEAGLDGQIGDRQRRIAIKPNLVNTTPAELGATTHPEVVAGIIEYLQERGFGNLQLIESSWVGDKTTDAIRECGYDRLMDRYGIPFVDVQQETSRKEDCAGMQLRITNGYQPSDFLINVPVLKGHCQTKMTCALKNMKGLIPSSEKRRFHTMGLHKPIAHLSAAIRQDFIVVDHICGDLDFEDGGNPVVRNCVMVGMDPVLVDSFACKLLHYQAADVPYVVMAEQLGSGSTDLSGLEVVSYHWAEEREKMQRQAVKLDADQAEASERLSRGHKLVEVQNAVAEIDSCSACYGTLIPVLDRLREEGLLDRLPDRICIGQGYRGKTGLLGVGNCTAGFQHSVKGCPPTEEDIYAFLLNCLN